MISVPPAVLTLIGVIVLVIVLLFIAHQLTSALVWAILLGPALGNAVFGFITDVVQGQTTQALESLRFAPFFMSAIDTSFFAKGTNGIFIIIGFIYLFLWTYILGKYLIRHEHLWGLVMLPPLLYVVGLGFPCFRAQIATWVPSLSWLVMPLYGLPALIILTAIPFLIAYLVWRRS